MNWPVGLPWWHDLSDDELSGRLHAAGLGPKHTDMLVAQRDDDDTRVQLAVYLGWHDDR